VNSRQSIEGSHMSLFAESAEPFDSWVSCELRS